jgi:hypothetical protein
MVGAPRGEIRVHLSATQAMVLIPIRLGAKATPGALRVDWPLLEARCIILAYSLTYSCFLDPACEGRITSGLEGRGSML